MPEDTHEYKSYEPAHQVSDVVDLLGNKLESSVLDIDRFNSGFENVVYGARLEDGREVVMKVSPARRGWDQFAQEVWAYDQAREVGVSTPEILVHDESKKDFPENYFIMMRLPGISGDRVELSPNQRINIARQLGGHLSRLHTVHFPGFGKLYEKRGGGFFTKHTTLPDYLYREMSDSSWWVDQILGAGLLQQEDIAKLRKRFEENNAVFELQQGSLVHGDISMSLKNVLIENGNVSGIIDFEEVSIADPVKDFAYFDFWNDNPEYFEALKEGYENKELFDKNFERKCLLYKLYMTHYLMAYFHDRGDNNNVESMKEKKRQFEEELDRFI